jgi:hypothetical protein
VCSKCEHDGYRGSAVTREQAEIHEAAMGWAHEGWFDYEISFDAQTGVNWIRVKAEGSNAFDMSMCEFMIYLFGLEQGARRNRETAGGA